MSIKIIPQLVSKQAVRLTSESGGRMRKMRITAVVAYANLQNAKLDHIAESTNFKVIIRIGKAEKKREVSKSKY